MQLIIFLHTFTAPCIGSKINMMKRECKNYSILSASWPHRLNRQLTLTPPKLSGLWPAAVPSACRLTSSSQLGFRVGVRRGIVSSAAAGPAMLALPVRPRGGRGPPGAPSPAARHPSAPLSCGMRVPVPRPLGRQRHQAGDASCVFSGIRGSEWKI
jgi:hypothetical protein